MRPQLMIILKIAIQYSTQMTFAEDNHMIQTFAPAVCADEPAGKPISKCAKRTVSLTLHRGAEDDRLLQQGGPEGFRRARIPDLCQEALSQGVLLTREDLAYRIFFNHPRTITRDLAAIRKQDPQRPVPLRSTVQDIGP